MKITLDQFLTKWTGKPCDYDGAYGNQCMDLMHYYIDDVVTGESHPELLRAPTAALAYSSFNLNPSWGKYFIKIDNTPLGVPKRGDIIFWKAASSLPSGHVAIFLEGSILAFTSFDQNWPVGSLPHVQSHTYANVAGWLRPLNYEVKKYTVKELTAMLTEAVKEKRWE